MIKPYLGHQLQQLVLLITIVNVKPQFGVYIMIIIYNCKMFIAIFLHLILWHFLSNGSFSPESYFALDKCIVVLAKKFGSEERAYLMRNWPLKSGLKGLFVTALTIRSINDTQHKHQESLCQVQHFYGHEQCIQR